MRTLTTIMLFIVSLGVSGFSLAADPIIIKFSHVVAPNTPKGKARNTK